MANAQEKQANDNRTRALQRGDQLNTDIGTDIGKYQGAYGSGYNATNDALARLGASPGYTPEEQQNIIRQQQLESLQNGTDYNSNYLSPEEYAGIYGNPNAALQAYDPGALSSLGNTSDANTRAAVGQTAGNLRANTAQTAAGLKAAVDPSKLGLSGDYTQGVSNVLNKTAGDIHGAIDPSKLGISGDYSKALNFGDKDVQDIEAAAGTSEGQRFANEEQQLRQKAIEQGNTSPAAQAALMERLNAQEGSAAGDAMTDARIKAKQAQMGAAQSKEATRLGSEQYISGQNVNAGQYLGNLAANEVGQQEQMRLGTEQDLANRGQQNAALTGQMGQQTEEYTGAQNLGNENSVAARDIGIEQGNQATGQKLLGAADQASSDRSGALAQNRQNTNLSNQGNQFNRGLQVQTQIGAGNQTAANARRADTGAYIQGEQHQQDQAQQGATTARGQQAGAAGQEGQLANADTQTALSASQKPGLFGKIAGAALGGLSALGAAGGKAGIMGLDAGGVVSKPTVAMVGEHGPELIKPVSSPSMKMLGINSGEDEGSAPPPAPDFNYTAYSGPGEDALDAPPNKPSGISGLAGAAQKVGTGIMQGWQNGIQAPPSIPRYSGGKMVTRPTIAVLGENGPEAVIPFNRTGATKMSTASLMGSKIPSQGYRFRHPTAPITPFGPASHMDPMKMIGIKV